MDDALKNALLAVVHDAQTRRAQAIESMVAAHAGHVTKLVYRNDAPGVLERIEAVDAYGAVLAHVDIVQDGQRVLYTQTDLAERAERN